MTQFSQAGFSQLKFLQAKFFLTKAFHAKSLLRTLACLPLALTFSACNPQATHAQIQGQTTTTAPYAQIQVSATGQSHMVPDVATVSAGVVTQGKTARGAMLNNAAKMTRVFKELEAAKIETKNITTSQLSLQPRYNYKDRQSPTIDAYEARNTVTAKTYDLDAVGLMLDALVKAGVNNINGVQFSVRDPKAAKDKARKDAIVQARAKAMAMADAAGVKLGKLRLLSETTPYNAPPIAYARMSAESSASPTPIAAGEQTLSVSVNMVYEIVN